MKETKNNLGELLTYLEDIIKKRKHQANDPGYTNKLLKADLSKVIQKVGEESIEMIIEATLKNRDRTIYESADLLYHLLVLWNKLDISLEDLAEELNKRKK